MKQLTLLLLIIVLTGCKQKHTCACSNPGGVFETHIIKGTATEAKS